MHSNLYPIMISKDSLSPMSVINSLYTSVQVPRHRFVLVVL